MALFISRVYNFAAGTANINEIQRPVNFCKSKTETVLLVLHSSRNAMNFFFFDSVILKHLFTESTKKPKNTID